MSDPELLAAYLATAWTVESPDGPLSVRFNHAHPGPLLRPSGIITAFNPASEPRSELENRRAHDALHLELVSRGLPFRPAASHPAGPRSEPFEEPGFAVLGDVLEELVELGRRFGQNAVVWIDVRGGVSLVCTRDGFCGREAGDTLAP